MTTATARKTDPVTSHAAADRMNQGDSLTRDEQFTLKWVRMFPGHSAKQLERLANDEAQRIHRRAKGLETKGEIKRVNDGTGELKLYLIKKNQISYCLDLFNPDLIHCDCGKKWTVHSISLTGGYVTCPNCSTMAYLPERRHYE